MNNKQKKNVKGCKVKWLRRVEEDQICNKRMQLLMDIVLQNT